MYKDTIVLVYSSTELDESSDVSLVGVNIPVDRLGDIVVLDKETLSTAIRDFEYRAGIDDRHEPLRSELIDCHREAFKAGESYGISVFAFH
jgi:hypothetical protein